MTQWANRLRLIYPENYSKFSSTISISRLVLESPTTLAKLKSIIEGSPAYIVAGQHTSSDVCLAVELKVPIFGSPLEASYLSTQSGSYSLFKSCQIPTIPTARDIYLYE